MKHKRNWFIAIAVTATATFIGLQTVNAPTQDEIVAPETVEIAITETPAQPEGNCYFQWATKFSPELTDLVDVEIKKINQKATARVNLQIKRLSKTLFTI